MTETITGSVESFDGTTLAYYVNPVENAKGWVVFAHGLTAYALLYDKLAQRLNENGYSVLRYDHRGHGKSGGERVYLETGFELVDDAYEIIKLAKTMSGGLPLFFMGHSMGGFAAIGFGCRYSAEVNGIIITAASHIPPNRPEWKLAETADLHERLPNPGSKEIGKKGNGEPITDPLAAKFVHKGLYVALQHLGRWMSEGNLQDFTAPCLMIQGAADLVVPAADSEAMFKLMASGNKARVVLDGVGHNVYLPEHFVSTMNQVISFLDSHI